MLRGDVCVAATEAGVQDGGTRLDAFGSGDANEPSVDGGWTDAAAPGCVDGVVACDPTAARVCSGDAVVACVCIADRSCCFEDVSRCFPGASCRTEPFVTCVEDGAPSCAIGSGPFCVGSQGYDCTGAGFGMSFGIAPCATDETCHVNSAGTATWCAPSTSTRCDPGTYAPTCDGDSITFCDGWTGRTTCPDPTKVCVLGTSGAVCVDASRTPCPEGTEDGVAYSFACPDATHISRCVGGYTDTRDCVLARDREHPSCLVSAGVAACVREGATLCDLATATPMCDGSTAINCASSFTVPAFGLREEIACPSTLPQCTAGPDGAVCHQTGAAACSGNARCVDARVLSLCTTYPAGRGGGFEEHVTCAAGTHCMQTCLDGSHGTCAASMVSFAGCVFD